MTRKNAQPLRTIVAVVTPAPDAFSRQKVRLKCGHEVWASSNAIYRARCRHCAAEAAQEETSG